MACTLTENDGSVRVPRTGGRGAGAVRACVKKLSPYAQQLIRMRYVDELSALEVAERLNRSPNTIYVALSRTYRYLAGCVERRLAREGA